MHASSVPPGPIMSLQKLFLDPSASFGSRREFLRRAGNGMGLLALAHLFEQEAHASGVSASQNPMAARPSHFPAKAKNVIWLFMNGGPSHVDTWDFKPELAKRDGQELKGFDKTTGFFADQVGPVMKSPFRFAQHGQSGAWVSELFPAMARHVDKMAFIHSCWTDSNNHSPALFKINTGMARMGFPCLGSWLTYGLGNESQNLPAFVVMYDTLGRGIPKGHSQNWGQVFSRHLSGNRPAGSGRADQRPLPPADRTDRQQRNQLDLMARLNRRHLEARTRRARAGGA